MRLSASCFFCNPLLTVRSGRADYRMATKFPGPSDQGVPRVRCLPCTSWLLRRHAPSCLTTQVSGRGRGATPSEGRADFPCAPVALR